MTAAAGEPCVIEALSRGRAPLAAAAQFHAEVRPMVESAASRNPGSVVIRFDAVDANSHGWRSEAVAALARAHAPLRVNGVAPLASTTCMDAVDGTIRFLAGNAGVTGQLFLVD